MAATFAELVQSFGVRWLRKPRAASFVGALAAQQDEIAARLAGAVLVRLASRCPDDALDDLGRTFNLERAPGESNASFRAYLRGAWTIWASAGTEARLRAELRRIWPDAEIHTWRALADGGNPGAFGGDPSCFYVTATWASRFPISWDDGSTYDGGSLWDLGFPADVDRSRLGAARSWLQKWKLCGKTCRYIELTLQSGRVVRVPTRERWEYGADGGATTDYYNTGY